MSEDKNSKTHSQHLISFEKIKEWTDLGNWLQKTGKLLETYPTKHLPHKKLLSKRLSQCLNDSLPIGIHRTTLNLYVIIFEHIKEDKDLLCKNIPLFSFGLFPFFPQSSIQVKPDVIEMFNRYYLILGIELIPILSGLLSCLLPGLDEQDNTIQKLIYELINKINQVVGDKYFINTLWFILLKNSKNRLNAIKILSMKFQQKNSENQINEKEENQIEIQENVLLELVRTEIKESNNTDRSYFTNCFMIINALKECLEDQEIMVKKNSLDFMINYLPIKNTNLFKDKYLVSFCYSILKLFEVNDLSIIKRVFKLLFDEGNVQNFEIGEENSKMVQILIEAFLKLLQNDDIQNDQQCKLPFTILLTLKHNNKNLLQKILNSIALEMLHYSYKHGYCVKQSKFPTVIVENLKYFIQTYKTYLNDFIDNFLEQLQGSLLNDFYFLEFLVKVFLSESDINVASKICYIAQLMRLSQNYTAHLFSQKATTSILITQLSEFDKFIYFSKESTTIIQDLLRYANVQEIREEVYQTLSDILNYFTLVVDKFIKSNIHNSHVIDEFSNYFQVLMKLDILRQDKCEELTIESIDNLPDWIKLLFKYMQSEYEILCYQSLNFIYFLLQDLQDNKLISKYMNFIFNNKQHYEENEICWKMIQKLIYISEIYDFRIFVLNFIYKFLTFNISFVQKYFAYLLDKQTPIEFRKIALLWKTSSKNQNLDFQLILQESVFNMLGFIKINDPLMRNYFKDWLSESQSNFSIILNSVIKQLLEYTKWSKSNSKIYYNVQFDCKLFIKSIEDLNVLLEYGKVNFLLYMISHKICEEFDVFNDEINNFLENKCEGEKETVYIHFLVKILVRYLVGNLNKDLKYSKQIGVHLRKVVQVKEQILIYLEKLISSLNNEDIIAQISLYLIPIFVTSLENALEQNQTTLQLEYLNILNFLIFRTKLNINSSTKQNLQEIMKGKSFLNIFLLGLKNKHSFVIEEFCSFLNKLYFILASNFKHPLLTQMVRNVIFAYLENISERSQQIYSLKQEEMFQEQISVLLDGLADCLNFFLQVDEIEEKISRGTFEKAFLTVFTLGIIRTEEEIHKKISFLKDETTCKHIISNFEYIFEKLLFCWKDIKTIREMDLWKKYSFNTIYTNMYSYDNLLGLSLKIINIIKPLCDNFIGRTLEAILQNWIKNNEELTITNFYIPESNLKNIKIMELIIYLNLSRIRILYAILNSKQILNIKALKRYEQKHKKLILIKDSTQYEINVLSFIYCYLKYNKFNEKNYFEIYGIVLKILKNFEESQTPSTLLWIIEIITVLLNKLKLQISNYYKLKNDWLMFIKDILLKITKIIAKDTILIYSLQKIESEIYLPLSPSIYSDPYVSNRQLMRKSCKNEKELIFGFDCFKENVMHDLRYRYFLINSFLQNSVTILNIFFVQHQMCLFHPGKVQQKDQSVYGQFI